MNFHKLKGIPIDLGSSSERLSGATPCVFSAFVGGDEISELVDAVDVYFKGVLHVDFLFHVSP